MADPYEAPFPHCDQDVLHAPKECAYCDLYPKAQQERIDQKINFSGHADPDKRACPSTIRRAPDVINRWPGNRAAPKETPMPNLNLTFLNVVIDRSGSMSGLIADTVGGFNKFLEDQKSAPGSALMTLTYFDDKTYTPCDAMNIKDIHAITAASYWEGGGGGTALLDAVGNAIESCKKAIETLPEGDRPGKVIFLIITDGEENSSRKFSGEQVRNLVAAAKEMKWDFNFLGANIDAAFAAANIGVNAANAANYSNTKGGTSNAYGLLSHKIGNTRMVRSAGVASGQSAESMEMECSSFMSYGEQDRAILASDVAVDVKAAVAQPEPPVAPPAADVTSKTKRGATAKKGT